MRYVCGGYNRIALLFVLSTLVLWSAPASATFKHIHFAGCKHDHRHDNLKKKHKRWCEHHLIGATKNHGKKFLERWKQRCEGDDLPPPVCKPTENYSSSYVANETFQWPFKHSCNRKDFRNLHDRRWGFWSKGVYTFANIDLVGLQNVQLQHETIKMKIVVDSLDDIKVKNLKISLNGFEGKPIDMTSVNTSVISRFRVDGDNKRKGKCEKGDDFDNGYLVEMTFHLEKFIFAVNYSAADILRLSKNATFKVIPNKRVLRSSEVTLTMDGVNLNVCNPPPPVCSCENYDPSKQQCGTLGADSCGNPNKCGPAGTLNCEPPPPVCTCAGYDPAQTQCGALGSDSCGNPGVCGPPGTFNCPPPPPPPCNCDSYDPSQTQCGALGTDSCGNVGACAPAGTLNCPPPPPVCTCNNYDPASTQCGMLGADSCGNPGVCGPPGTLNCEPPPPPPAPIVTITNTSVGALTNINDIAIEFAADVPASFQCSLDGSALANCASPFSATDLADGAHHFSVIGINEGGASVPASYDWSIDTTAPIANIDTAIPSTALTDQTQIEFTFSSNEIATFQCRIDSATFVDCASPLTASNLLDGPHSFYVRAIDLAGNTGPADSHNWTVKTTAPTVQITSVVPSANPSNISMRTYTFTGSADTHHFVCSLDGSADTNCASPYSLMGIADGGHIFRVKSVDALNKKSLPDSESFTIDTVAPVVTIVSAVPSQSPTNSNAIQISFASDDAASFVCQLDSMASMACTSPIDIGALSDGLHNFQVVGTDVAGNVSSPAVYGWTVDTTAPILTITSVLPSGFMISQNNITVNFSTNEPSTVTCQLDAGTPSDCSSGSISASGLSDGAHLITMTPRDDVNNLGATVGYSFSVDTTGPTVAITAVTPAESLTNISDVAISFTSSESVAFRCSLDGSAYVTCTSPASYTNLSDGGHIFAVIGVDALGNMSAAPASYSWTIDTSTPSVSITSHTPVNSPTNIQSMSLTFVATEMGSFSCQLDALSWTSCTSPANYNGLADGTHAFKVLATDLAGNTSPTAASYTWVVDTVVPVTTITSTSIVESPTDVTDITVNFTANEASTFECRLDGGSYSSCLSPVSYSGLLPGSHTVSVRATDLAGNTDNTGASYTWSITAPPLILSGNAVSNITQTSARITWTSNRNANTQGAIRVGISGPYTFTSIDTGMVTIHTVTFTGLTANTLYNVYGISNDGFNTVNTPVMSFRTLR